MGFSYQRETTVWAGSRVPRVRPRDERRVPFVYSAYSTYTIVHTQYSPRPRDAWWLLPEHHRWVFCIWMSRTWTFLQPEHSGSSALCSGALGFVRISPRSPPLFARARLSVTGRSRAHVHVRSAESTASSDTTALSVLALTCRLQAVQFAIEVLDQSWMNPQYHVRLPPSLLILQGIALPPF